MQLIHSILILLHLALLGIAIDVRHKYIVEFNDEPGLAKRSQIGDPAEAFHDVLRNSGVISIPRHSFSFPSLKGATFEVVHRSDPKQKRSAEDPGESLHHDIAGTLAYIRSLPEVKHAWVPEKLFLDKDFAGKTSVNGEADINGGDGDKLWTSLHEAHVDQVHDKGIFGEGQVVAILDSGVNYTHPALGGGIGSNYKVLGGYNYIDDTKNSTEWGDSIISDDPMDCYGHGTMVAGVIAGNSSRLMGVAPNANLRAYRIFDCSGESSEEILLASLKQAQEDGVDVINLSLGSSRSWSQLPSARVASDLTHDGILVITSAGNSGYYGGYTAGSFGAGDDVLSVGSLFADELITFDVEGVSSNGDRFDFEYVSLNGTQSELNGSYTFEVFDISACSYTTLRDSVDGRSTRAIVPKGSCDLETQADNLDYLGYTHVIFYSSSESDKIFYGQDYSGREIEVMFSPRSFGNWAVNQAEQGRTVSVQFDTNSIPKGEDSGLISNRMDNSSSWGPTFDNKFFPSVSAPGGFIYTTDSNGTYTVTRGTSFSAPYVAGVAALFLESKNSTNSTHENIALEFNSRIISSSQFIRAYDGYRHYRTAEPTIHQGAGMIDALTLIEEKTIILSEPVLSLNDTRFRKSSFTIEIYNGNSEEVTYNSSNVLAASVRAKDAYGEPDDATYPYQYKSFSGASVYPSSFTLRAGQSRKVTVVFMPIGISDESGISFGGKILFSGDNGDIVGVPYMGEYIKGNKPYDTNIFLMLTFI